MRTTVNLHVEKSDPIVVESSPDGAHVWVRIGGVNGTAVHVADYVTACALVDTFTGLAHIMNPANTPELANTYDYG